jgi:hypothetical protein
MRRSAAKILLGLVTAAIPVAIAACYGPAAVDGLDGSTSGWVRNRATGRGIAGIEVRCMRDGDVVDANHTGTDGAFTVTYPIATPCDSLVATDVDGPSNGSYGSATERLTTGTSIVIYLDSSS